MAGSPPESPPGYVTGTSSPADRLDRPGWGDCRRPAEPLPLERAAGPEQPRGTVPVPPRTRYPGSEPPIPGAGPLQAWPALRPDTVLPARPFSGRAAVPTSTGNQNRESEPGGSHRITARRCWPPRTSCTKRRRRPCGPGHAPGVGHLARTPGRGRAWRYPALSLHLQGATVSKRRCRESPVPRQPFRRIPLRMAVNRHPPQPHLQRGPVRINPREAPAPAMSPIGAPVAGPRATQAWASCPGRKGVTPKTGTALPVPCNQSGNRRWPPWMDRFYTSSAPWLGSFPRCRGTSSPG